ncbi:DUF262 domain-containing protein [Brevundimonas sp. MEB006b]|uniref:DUF262 domain-containing protein n=1 Tax=Brevundimonas sp. MEB006b TaxID=3040283 RepID=UPI0025501F34|nr:DUF262 domain-containing protein [Brevundimonas sp. MEB006b]
MAGFLQIARTEFTVAQYIGWMRSGELELNPNFQRRSVWKPPAKSYFIDTVVRGLPIPIIFLRERTDLNTLRTLREVVDGQQRLRTLFSYIAPDLVPGFVVDRDGFTVSKVHNSDIGGLAFGELSASLREQIISYQISTHVLPASTSDAEVLDMFRRMNASGVKLNAQELRNAKFFGHFSQTSKTLSTSYLETWRNWRIFNESDFARMKEVEFVSELLMLTERGIQEKTQPSIDATYKRLDNDWAEMPFILSAFEETMNTISSFAGGYIARSAFRNSAVFYSLFAALLDLRFGPVVNRTRRRENLPQRPDLEDRLRSISRALDARDQLPPEVQAALNSRSNRARNRTVVRDYIHAGLTTNAGPN